MKIPSRAKQLQYLRRILEAHAEQFLVTSGMDYYHDQFFYKYTDESIQFAEVSVRSGFHGEHWKSLGCTLHLYFHNFPGFGKPRMHESGRPIPTYRQSRLRFGQDRTLDQSAIVATLNSERLKYDRGIWHVLDDESNVTEVLHDMAQALKVTGLPMVAKPIYGRAAMLEREIAARAQRS